MPTFTHPDIVDQAVVNDAFYGDLNLKNWQERYRLPASVAPVEYTETLALAIDEVNEELAEWKAARELEGVANLAALDTLSMPPGASTRYYTAAVFARAYALILPMLSTEFFNDEGDGPQGDVEERQGLFIARSDRYLSLLRGDGPALSFGLEVI